MKYLNLYAVTKSSYKAGEVLNKGKSYCRLQLMVGSQLFFPVDHPVKISNINSLS